MAGINRQILLKSRPEGAPSLDNFELTQGPTPEPGEGEVLIRILYLSLDPYMRGRMSAAKSYATPAAFGRPMVGGTVGEIVKTRNSKYSVASAMAAGRNTRFRTGQGCAPWIPRERSSSAVTAPRSWRVSTPRTPPVAV
jgi:NADPH-dependent curcumin reductase CurA